MKNDAAFKLDLFRVPVLGRIFFHPAFPLLAQTAVLAVFGFLVANGWGVGVGEKPAFLKILRKTNTTTLTVWGVWWPLMVLGAILLGRAWCMICPMELVNNIFHRLGLRLGTARLRLWRPLQLGFAVLLVYVTLQLLVGVVSLHRVPAYTAVMMLSLLALAALSGLLFREDRSFCKAFCPANLLLSVYGRLSRVEIDVRDPSVCEKCTTRDCFRPDRLDHWTARSCPSRVKVFDRRKGDACVLCLECAKACPNDNIGYGIAAGGARSLRTPELTTAEALFVFFVSGFITHELFTEIGKLEWIYHWPAKRIQEFLGSGVSWGWIHTGWYLIGFPLVLWSVILLGARVLGAKESIGTIFRKAATAAFPLVAAAHAAKALAKINSWSGFIIILTASFFIQSTT